MSRQQVLLLSARYPLSTTVTNSHLLLHLTQSNRYVWKKWTTGFCRTAGPTDRPTNRSNNNTYISVPGCPIKHSTHGSYRLHLTTNIFRSLVFYVGYQNKSQEYLPSVPLRLSTAQPRHPLNGAMHPPPTSCKECPTHPPMLTADFLGLELPTAPFPAGTPSHEGRINVSFWFLLYSNEHKTLLYHISTNQQNNPI